MGVAMTPKKPKKTGRANEAFDQEKTRIRQKTVGTFLQRARVASGISQAEAAKRLGYTTPQFISNWERGLALPPLYALPELVEVYGIHSHELIEAMDEFYEGLRQLKRRRLTEILSG